MSIKSFIGIVRFTSESSHPHVFSLVYKHFRCALGLLTIRLLILTPPNVCAVYVLLRRLFTLGSDAEKFSLNAFAKMNIFRKRGQLCDVVVKVGGRVFPAHRVVLAASSDYFGAMFSNGVSH